MRVRSTLGATRPAPAQLGQVEQVEGGDARADAVELHAREQAALEREREQALVLEDVEHEPRVLEVVGDQGGGLFAIEALISAALSSTFGIDQLAAAEQRAADGLEPVVLEAHGVAHQRDPVEDHAAGNGPPGTGA